MNEKQNYDDIGENKQIKEDNLSEYDADELSEDWSSLLDESELQKDRLEDQGLLQEKEFIENLAPEKEYETVSYPEYMQHPEKYAGRAVVVIDQQLDCGEPNGFSVEMQKKFGWRKEEKYDSDLLEDYEKKHGDYEHPGNYTNERGLQGRLASLVKNPKEQNITPAMMRAELYRRAELVDTYGEIKDALLDGRNEMFSELFGRGNPLAAYQCFLDQEALKNSVYMFDRRRVQEFLDSFSNENLAKDAKKIYKKVQPYDMFAQKLRQYLRVQEVDLPEGYTCRDVLEHAPANAVPNTEQQEWLCSVLIAMQQLHNLRGFFGLIMHPIDYFWEWKFIDRAIDVMVNDFHIERARIHPPALDDSNIIDFRPIRMTEVGDFVVVDYADELEEEDPELVEVDIEPELQEIIEKDSVPQKNEEIIEKDSVPQKDEEIEPELPQNKKSG